MPRRRLFRISLLDRSIATKFSVVTALVLVVCLAMAITGTLGLMRLESAQKEAHESSTKPLSQLIEVTRSFGAVRERASLYPVVSTDVRVFIEDALTEEIEALRKNLASYKPYASSSDAYASMKQTVDTYLDTQLAEMRTSTMQGDSEYAVNLLSGPMSANASLIGHLLRDESNTLVTHAAAQLSHSEATSRRSIVLVWAALILGITGLVLTLRRIISQLLSGVDEVSRSAAAIAEGDLTVPPEVEQRDEIGQMAHGIASAVERLRGIVSDVAGATQTVANSAGNLTSANQRVAAGATSSSDLARSVAAAAVEVSESVQSVAAGSEQMGASIEEIARSTTEASQVAQRASAMAETTTGQVARLGQSSAEIGEVVDTISAIAAQTNMLALNATIEAARAGNAGRGFAVVAGEVKELAAATATATADIARRVESIQSDTSDTIAAISEISTIIADISSHQQSIASAVEEQTVTTAEMARNVAAAATKSSEISTTISDVAATSEETSQVVVEMGSSVDELVRTSEELGGKVSTFSC